MMNYFSALLFIMLVSACHSPQVESLTQLTQTNTNHLTAFSRDSLPAHNGVRLAEVRLNGRRFLRYVYKDGYLTDEITYSTDERAIYLRTSHYNRDQRGLLSIETRGRTYEEGVVDSDTTRLLSTALFNRPSDLAVAFELMNSTFVTNLTFAKNGSLLGQANPRATTTYLVDSDNNISSATTTFNDVYPPSQTINKYQYDHQFNPFQTTGRVGPMTKFSTFETDYSPNNVTETRFYNPEINYTNTTRYSYVYRSDGYPTQVTIEDSRESVYKPVLTFIYTK